MCAWLPTTTYVKFANKIGVDADVTTGSLIISCVKKEDLNVHFCTQNS